jgi:hypothetical protein
MYSLSEKSKNIIQRRTGIDPSKVSMMDHEEIDELIEKKIGKKLELGLLKAKGLTARGNVYIHLGRLISDGWISKRLSKI